MEKPKNNQLKNETPPDGRWREFFEKTRNEGPSSMLIEAVTYATHRGKALDLGAGALKDTRYLLSLGFEVTATDSSPLIKFEGAEIKNQKLKVEVSTFSSFNFPTNEYDIINASRSLPFGNADTFDTVIENIKRSLKVGGVFCAHFAGKSSSLGANKNFATHTKEEVEKMFEGFDIIDLKEDIWQDKAVVNGRPTTVDWIYLIARKTNND